MVIGSTLPYVYGKYLMSPHTGRAANQVNKNSFGRLINSYYGKHSLFKKTLPLPTPTELLEVNEDAKALQTFAKNLYDAGELFEEGKEEEAEGALTKFLTGYNRFVTSFSKIENEEVEGKSSAIRQAARHYGEELSAIGIECEEDGTLTIGENGICIKEMQSLKDIFQGKTSFAAAICRRAEIVGKEALSLLTPAPRVYGESGSIQYVIQPGALFSTWC